MPPILSCRDVSKHFGALKAVDDVSFDVAMGSIHSIIGPNGAGKTTLFNCISSELTPTAGQIIFDGTVISGKQPSELPDLGIGRSFQKTSIFPQLTVGQNVWLPSFRKQAGKKFELFQDADARRDVTETAMTALSRSGLTEYAAMPAASLSHGDQRLLDLAIALAADPRLLLLDEPAAGLSRPDTNRIMHLIEGLKGRHTVLLIEHKMDVVMRISDRISVMHLGRLIAEGNPHEIRSNEKVRDAYLGRLA
jgi:branched-chain amino acid transport system ATP-binding protein